ncbi:MAG: lactate utilization protein C [Bacteroidota bacterium]
MKNIFCAENQLQEMLTDSGIAYLHQKEQLAKAMVGITTCESLVARTGSILVSSVRNTRVLTIYPSVHIVIAYSSQVVMEIKDSLQQLKNKYGRNMPSMISYITGPSRTSDIERKIVTGAHGPKELYVFLIQDVKQ